MKLNRNELKNKEAWAEIGIGVPNYDVAEAVAKAVEAPRWIHFGIGNIFRIFLGGIADELLEKGLLDRGITCIETFDFDVVDKIYTPYDDLVLSVILKSDGTRDMKVLGSLAEGIKADPGDAEQWGRMLAAFASQDLQLITFTITEKGYALTSSDGVYLPYVQKDIENGPDQARGAMGVVAAGLFRRFEEGALPVALVSMDNCANNGRLLKESVVTMAEEWAKLGFVPEAFVEYVSDEETVAFCCTMIDKITPRPSEQIADDLEALGIEDMQPVITSKRTYIAPFANGEGPQYVVIEDRFPNGRPMLEEGFGVYLGDYDTVSRSERMKVTALLNPVHSATGPIGVVLGIDLFADMLEQVPAVLKLAKAVEEYSLSFDGMVCMDIGASTGGFTDCMLQNGAAKVYAVDVGYGQLDWSLRNDPRVVCMEKTNIRYVKPEDIPDRIRFASVDVSFISLTKVLPPAKELMTEDGEIVCLIKPQFEAGREKVGKKGVVRDPAVHEEVIRNVIRFAAGTGFVMKHLTWSPIKGPEGNIEYLLHMALQGEAADLEAVCTDTVKKAHQHLDQGIFSPAH